MRSIAYPDGWFYVERASVIMFGLSATLAPKLNGIQVGFPYVTQFVIQSNQKRLQAAAESARFAKIVDPPAESIDKPGADKLDEGEALLN